MRGCCWEIWRLWLVEHNVHNHSQWVSQGLEVGGNFHCGEACGCLTCTTWSPPWAHNSSCSPMAEERVSLWWWTGSEQVVSHCGEAWNTKNVNFLCIIIHTMFHLWLLDLHWCLNPSLQATSPGRLAETKWTAHAETARLSALILGRQHNTNPEGCPQSQWGIRGPGHWQDSFTQAHHTPSPRRLWTGKHVSNEIMLQFHSVQENVP